MSADDTLNLSDEEVAEEVIQALGLVQLARNENQELKKNFESLKNLHVQLQTAHQQLQGRYNALYDERVTVERQYQQLCESWRAELEDKQHQFDQARAQMMGPRDLDVLRVKLLEEVEGPYRHKCELLAKEAEMAQQSFVRLRREHEELQTAYKTLDLRSQSEMEFLRADHTAIVTDLKDRLAVFSMTTSRLAAAELQIKTLEKEKADALLLNCSLKEEIEDLRKEKSRAVTDKESISLGVERRVRAIQVEELELSGLVESLTRKNRHLAKELTEAHRAQEATHGQVLALMSSVASAQANLDATKRQHSAEKAALEAHFDEARLTLEDRVGGLLDEVSRKESHMAEMAMSHQQDMSRLSQSFEQAAASAAAEAADKLRAVKEELMQRTARVDVLTQTCEDYRQECEEAQRKAQAQKVQTQAETAALQLRLDDARVRVAQLEAELQTLKQECDTVRSDRMRLDLQLQHVTRRRDELEGRVAALEQELREGAVRREQLQQELDAAARRTEEMRAAHFSHMEASRAAVAAEKAALTKRYQAALKEQVACAALEVKKSKRRAKSALRTAQQLTDELADVKLRAHELETAGGQGLSGFMGGGFSDVMSPRDTGHSRHHPVLSVSGLHLGNNAYRPASSSVVDRQVLGDIADLKARQQVYLQDAAAAATAVEEAAAGRKRSEC